VVVAHLFLVYTGRTAAHALLMFPSCTVSVDYRSSSTSSSSSNTSFAVLCNLLLCNSCERYTVTTAMLCAHRFNRIGPFVDKLCQFLQPHSDENRMTLYKTVLCYYDGVQELFEYAKCECAITFANVGKVSYFIEQLEHSTHAFVDRHMLLRYTLTRD
jgi:hypothetical protein